MFAAGRGVGCAVEDSGRRRQAAGDGDLRVAKVVDQRSERVRGWGEGARGRIAAAYVSRPGRAGGGGAGVGAFKGSRAEVAEVQGGMARRRRRKLW